jgi:hypothetical protein
MSGAIATGVDYPPIAILKADLVANVQACELIVCGGAHHQFLIAGAKHPSQTSRSSGRRLKYCSPTPRKVAFTSEQSCLCATGATNTTSAETIGWLRGSCPMPGTFMTVATFSRERAFILGGRATSEHDHPIVASVALDRRLTACKISNNSVPNLQCARFAARPSVVVSLPAICPFADRGKYSKQTLTSSFLFTTV